MGNFFEDIWKEVGREGDSIKGAMPNWMPDWLKTDVAGGLNPGKALVGGEMGSVITSARAGGDTAKGSWEEGGRSGLRALAAFFGGSALGGAMGGSGGTTGMFANMFGTTGEGAMSLSQLFNWGKRANSVYNAFDQKGGTAGDSNGGQAKNSSGNGGGMGFGLGDLFGGGGGGGGGILGGLGSIFGGQDTQQANSAAAQQADPFGPYRERYIGKLNELFADPSALTDSSRFQAGATAVEGSSAARGMLNSGNTLAALQDYGQNSFDEYARLLAGLSGAGAVGGGANFTQQGQLAGSAGMTGGITQILGGLFGGGGGGLSSLFGGSGGGLGSLFGGGGGGAEAGDLIGSGGDIYGGWT